MLELVQHSASEPLKHSFHSLVDTHAVSKQMRGSWRGLRQGAHLVEHPVELVASLADTVAIVAVDHEDQALRVLEVMPPQRADLRGRPKGGTRQPARTA